MKEIKLLKVYLLLIVFAFMFFSCKSREKKTEQPASKSQQTSQTNNTSSKNSASSDSLFASIERTPCFGKCPVYSISIYESGYCVYAGKQNVTSIGFFYTWLSKDKLKEIKEFAERVDYMEMQDVYKNPNIADFPSTFTTVKLNGKTKRINNTHENPPKELVDFEKFLDSLFVDAKLTPLKKDE